MISFEYYINLPSTSYPLKTGCWVQSDFKWSERSICKALRTPHNYLNYLSGRNLIICLFVILLVNSHVHV